MPRILIASDAQWVIDEVSASLSMADLELSSLSDGAKVRDAVAESAPDLVILDLQMGNMGGYAVALDLGLEAGAGRAETTPILLLLDRSADVFMAKRSDVAGWLIKPLNPVRTRRAAQALLAGKTFFDDTQQPEPLNVSHAEAVEPAP